MWFVEDDYARVSAHRIGKGASYGCSIRGARLQHDPRGPSDHDNPIPPSNAWALYKKLCLRRVQANPSAYKLRDDPYRRPWCAACILMSVQEGTIQTLLLPAEGYHMLQSPRFVH